MTNFELDDFIPYRMAVASGKLSKSLSAVYKVHGINRGQWRILVYLGNKKGMIPSKEIREATQLDKVPFTRATAQLEQKNWIRRTKNNHDGRNKDMTITPDGQQAYEKIIADVALWYSDLITALGEDNIKTIQSATEIIQKNIK